MMANGPETNSSTAISSQKPTTNGFQYRPAEGRGTRRTFVTYKDRRYGLPPSDFPPSRLVKYSQKYQYSRILNFPYPGAHFQPRMNTIVVQVQGLSRFDSATSPVSSAAVGVFYGRSCSRNAFYPLPFQYEQTDHRAILEAIRCTILGAIKMRQTELTTGWKELIIMTDSAYAKKALSLCVWTWENKNWYEGIEGKKIENLEAVRQLHQLIKFMENSMNMAVRFWRVGREEIAGADMLAQKVLDSGAAIVLPI